MTPARRRPAHGWAMGPAAPQPLTFPEAQGPVFPEGHNHPRHALLGEAGVGSGGVFAHGTSAEDGPVTGEALASTYPGVTASRGPVADARPVAGARVVGLQGTAAAPAAREVMGEGHRSRGRRRQ